jgi:hypothetical protein
MRKMEGRQVNEIARLPGFLAAWDSSPPVRAAPMADSDVAGRSPHGNINLTGAARADVSLLLPRGYPRFYEYIEPGVRELVAIFVSELGLTTYTSCEGHRYEGGREDPDERHVGILLRAPEQRQLLLDLAKSADAALAAQGRRFQACEIAYMDHEVRFEDSRFDAVDLYVAKRAGAAWEAYFDELEEFTGALITALSDASRAVASGR